MIQGKKLVVVLPAYNAERTLESTYLEIPHHLVDEVVLVDDASADDTSALAAKLGIKHVIRHEKNRGYGGNQKTCYQKALELNADIVIMLHPDYQYTPKLIPAMADLISSGLYDMVLGSRILGKGALKGGMPLYKYIANRFLTLVQNILISEKLSEYHTGYRAYTSEILRTINFENNSEDFVFDNEFISQTAYAGFKIGEISCPTKYFKEASSINFRRSIKYGLGVLRVSFQHFFSRIGIFKSSLYKTKTG
jgi:glycosyltransferase involved in cell wall biosynthesis